MNPIDEIRKRHFKVVTMIGPRKGDTYCNGCLTDWKCDTQRVLDLLDEIERGAKALVVSERPADGYGEDGTTVCYVALDRLRETLRERITTRS